MRTIVTRLECPGYLALPVPPTAALLSCASQHGWGVFHDLHAATGDDVRAAATAVPPGSMVWLRLFEPTAEAVTVLAGLEQRPWQGVYLARSHWNHDELAQLDAIALPTGLIIQERRDLDLARQHGSLPLLARGNEAGGYNGPLGTLVLLQVMCREGKEPFLIEGGLGPEAATAAIRAGASGIVLSACLWGADLMPEALQRAARMLRAHEIMRLTDEQGAGYSFGLKPKPDLPALKLKIAGKERPVWRALLPPDHLPIGQDIELGRRRLKTQPSLSYHLSQIRSAIERVQGERGVSCPLPGEARWAAFLRQPLPIVQGPMARISDCPAFLAAVDSRRNAGSGVRQPSA